MAFTGRIWTDDSNVLSATINFTGDDDVATFQIDRGATVTAVTGITIGGTSTTAYTVDGNTITFDSNTSDNDVIAVTFNYTSNSLQFSNYADVSTVTTNGRAFVVENLSVIPTGIGNSGLRIDSGSLTIAEDEVIVTHQNQTQASTPDNAILLNGGDLIVEGSANENSPHTFLETMGNYASKTRGNVHATGSAALALVNGNITIGSADKPFARMISHKNFTIAPDSNTLTGGTGGPSTMTIQTLILQNPIKDTILIDAQLPNLGFRGANANYTDGASSFDTAILDGFNILDVSGPDSAASGMYPQNIVFRRASLLGDNGGGSRANNLIGIAYAAVNGNESTFDLICNTSGTSSNLAGANWFVLGNTDGPARSTRRFNGQKGGFVSNRLITVDTSSGGTDQRFWLPETNQRITGTDASVNDATAITGATDLGGIAFNPHITDTLDSGDQIPINGDPGRYSVVNGTPGAQLRLRTRMGWLPGGSSTSAGVILAETHQDGEYIYFGTQDLVIGTQAITYYTQGVQDLEVSISDATDPVIDALKSASIATTAISGATVTLPGLAEANNSATIGVALSESSATNVSVGEIFATIKAALVTRVATGVNTTVQATAEQYVNNWLDKIVTGTATVSVSNVGAAVELRSDNAYNNGVNLTIGANVNGTIAAGTNVTLQSTPSVPKTFTVSPPIANLTNTVLQNVIAAGGSFVYELDGTVTSHHISNATTLADVTIDTDNEQDDDYNIWYKPLSYVDGNDSIIFDYNHTAWNPLNDPSGSIGIFQPDPNGAVTGGATFESGDSGYITFNTPVRTGTALSITVTIGSSDPGAVQSLGWAIANSSQYMEYVAANVYTNASTRPIQFDKSGTGATTQFASNISVIAVGSQFFLNGADGFTTTTTTITAQTIRGSATNVIFGSDTQISALAGGDAITELGNELKSNQAKLSTDVRKSSLLQPASGTIPNTAD